MSAAGQCVCRLCGKNAQEIKGWLSRVNEKGVPGIWECRPSCDANLSPDDRVLNAINEDSAAARKEAKP